MDLIYTNPAMEDQGVLHAYKLDLAFGEDENDFELRLSARDHCCAGSSMLYIEGTEYGGIVDSIESDTAAQEVIYTGRTWHGILDSKVLEPDSGSDYLTVSGEAHDIIRTLVARCGLSDLFSVDSTDSGIYVGSYQMNRYISAYAGIRKMLQTADGMLQFSFYNGKVLLHAARSLNGSAKKELDSDHIAFHVKRNFNPVNHLICLGRGELSQREVVHIYADAQGKIVPDQVLFGIAERTAVFDYPNAESLEDLKQGGLDRMAELVPADEVSFALTAEALNFGIQERIDAVDNDTGLSAEAQIVKKIVTVENGQISISYEKR